MRHDTRRRLIRGAAATTTLGAFGVPQFAFAQGVQGAQVAPVRGGQLIVGSPGRPRHFNPALQSGSPMMPGAQLFASPLLIDRNWKPRPYQAESWSVSDDARSITLNLRKDAKFHDGISC